jgi:archaellum component FlaG (FlaF/FlaG flagellin family)
MQQSVTKTVVVQRPISPAPDARLIYVLEQKSQESFWERFLDDPNSFIIMLFTIVLGGAAIYQGYLLNKQDGKLVQSLSAANEANSNAKEANAIAKLNSEQQAKDMTESLSATRDSTLLAKDTAQRELRAYLSFETQTRDGGINGGLTLQSVRTDITLRIVFYITNRGKTPAYHVCHECDPPVLVDASGMTPITIDHEVRFPKSVRMLNPGEYIFLDVRLSHPLTQEFRTESKILLVTGKLNYVDVFDISRYATFAYVASIKDNAKTVSFPYSDGNYAN